MIVVLFTIAAVAFAGFVIYELRIAAAPMADLRLFARRSSPVEVMPRPIPARMRPGSSTSQVEVEVRWAIETRPAAAETMATPSSTRIATLPIRRPVKRATAKETSDSGRNCNPAWTGE